MKEILKFNTKRRLGGWFPADESMLEAFRLNLVEHVRTANLRLHPEVEKLGNLIKNDPVLRMNFTMAIDQATEAGHKLAYSNIDELMQLINGVMTMSPSFDTSALVGCPLNAILDWIMCAPAGFEAFRSPELNAQMKKVLNTWGIFLSSEASCTYLNTIPPKGWFCPEAFEAIKMSEFQYNKSKPYWGFTSWNDFFTRRFKPGERPVAEPDNSKVITSACESTPYAIEQNVKLSDTFWIKSQPYSLKDIFTESKIKLAEKFIGGTVYQAFLSAYNYHRWHAPVSGKISDVYLVDGTYYSEAESEGQDPAGPNNSEGYITAVATRMVIVIDCDDKSLGQIACVFVGMAEVSSCINVVKKGQSVKKGDEIGYFQFGGSTYCMIFQKNVVIQNFFTFPQAIIKATFENENPAIIKLNSTLAIVR
jgi:phosphatidylserine decarboxylase